MSVDYHFYNNDVTTASFEELKMLLGYLDRLGRPRPAITGGWAVYAYEGGIGSRDIDIVMTGEHDAVQHLEKGFFQGRNYEVKRTGMIPSHWAKTVMTEDGAKDIIVDIFHGDSKWRDEAGLGLEFEWGWTLEFQEELEVGGIKITVPKREILIITKMMAAVARKKEYDRTGRVRLPPKISKDYMDVARLTAGRELDSGFYREYLRRSKADAHLDSFLSGYRRTENDATLRDLGSTYAEIEAALGM